MPRLKYPEFANAVLQAWNSGMRMRSDLARHFGVHSGTITRAMRYLRDIGVQLDGKPLNDQEPLQPMETLTREAILYHQYSGYSIRQINTAYGVSRYKIENLLYDYGHKRPAGPLNLDECAIASQAKKEEDELRQYKDYITALRWYHPNREKPDPESWRATNNTELPKRITSLNQERLCSSALGWFDR